MKIIKYPERGDWQELLARPVKNFKEIKKIVKPIIKKVKQKGDKALRKFALEYDHVALKELQVSRQEIYEAEKLVSEELKEAVQQAKQNITRFHEVQIEKELLLETMPGVVCRRRSVPIQKVGLYIPGGTAPLFSSVLMLGIPANLAGCEQIVLCTPCNPKGKVNPLILYTANLIGIDRIVKVGGAQAIAAMAYGTESVPAVYKIYGPGNQYVTAAKQMISQEGIAIDMPAGPSEVAVFADETAQPAFVASDLLSQAEHGVDSQVLLVSTSESFVKKVITEINLQIEQLPRKDIAKKALNSSIAVVVHNNQDAIDILNLYAAEHLIISIAELDQVADKIVNAGSVFLGNFSPESVGDYASGTNHVLPTNGFARSFSGVSIDSFIKKITYQTLSADGLRNLGPVVEKLAGAEQLDAHKNAVSIRLKYLDENN